MFSGRQLFTYARALSAKQFLQPANARAKERGEAGIAVAFPKTVRPFFLAWLTLALLLLGLGQFTAASDELAIAGFVTATDQEATEGYFGVGDEAMMVVKQGTGLQRWLKAHSGQKIKITLEAALD